MCRNEIEYRYNCGCEGVWTNLCATGRQQQSKCSAWRNTKPKTTISPNWDCAVKECRDEYVERKALNNLQELHDEYRLQRSMGQYHKLAKLEKDIAKAEKKKLRVFDEFDKWDQRREAERRRRDRRNEIPT